MRMRRSRLLLPCSCPLLSLLVELLPPSIPFASFLRFALFAFSFVATDQWGFCSALALSGICSKWVHIYQIWLN